MRGVPYGQLHLGCDMVALHEFNVPKKEDHSTIPFRWQISQPNWWDDLAITPYPPTHWLPPSTPGVTSPPPPFTPPHPKPETEAWPFPTPSSLQPPISAQARYPNPPFCHPPPPPFGRD